MRLHWHATDVVRSHTDGLDDSEATSSDVDPRSTLNLRSVYRFSAVSLFWLRAAAFALSSLTTAVLVYTIAIDGSPYRSNLLHVPWLLETIVEYLENVVLLATWVAMRERVRAVTGQVAHIRRATEGNDARAAHSPACMSESRRRRPVDACFHLCRFHCIVGIRVHCGVEAAPGRPVDAAPPRRRRAVLVIDRDRPSERGPSPALTSVHESAGEACMQIE